MGRHNLKEMTGAHFYASFVNDLDNQSMQDINQRMLLYVYCVMGDCDD